MRDMACRTLQATISMTQDKEDALKAQNADRQMELLQTREAQREQRERLEMMKRRSNELEAELQVW